MTIVARTPPMSQPKPSRYVVGIDLGTTNCALAYRDAAAAQETGSEHAAQVLDIPQVVQQGLVESRQLLPSFLYLPAENEQPAGALKLPWDLERNYTVGTFARQFGSQVPTRLVSSAKSWLCHDGIDRRAAVLPWKAPEDGRRVSPMEAMVRYLSHLVEAWNAVVAEDREPDRLEHQEIVLTVPASFDAVARELTVEAARAAGLENLTLLEEPQAAFYAWLDAQGDSWRENVAVGDLILVADLGGGTTDFTLIRVTDDAGQLSLARLAVGDHLLLGGDNMDLALAYAAMQKLGGKLDAHQVQQLSHSCRAAKEELFADPDLESVPVTVLGRGSRLIGGTLKTELTRDDLNAVLMDGFFPECDLSTEPSRQRAAGFQEVGLPYVSDPAVTKHLAQFLSRQGDALAEQGEKLRRVPNALLFNGGVFKAGPMRDRLLGVLDSWAKASGEESVRALEGTNLDLAVARGAAYYGVARRGKGVRIRGGTARAYYIGVESAMPAVPGMPPPLKALCVVPFGMEEGTETDVPSQHLNLVVGEEVQFRFLGSTLRRQDVPGELIEDWQPGEIEELSPVMTTLEADDAPTRHPGGVVPVRLHSKVNEVGQLELWCHGRDGGQWKLEFNVRESKD